MSVLIYVCMYVCMHLCMYLCIYDLMSVDYLGVIEKNISRLQISISTSEFITRRREVIDVRTRNKRLVY